MSIGKIFKNIGGAAKLVIAGQKNLILRAFTESLKPKWIWFELTDRCNSRCTHCNIWHMPSTKNPLTAEEIERVFAEDLFKDLEFIILSGGEITLRNDLEDIILRIHKILPRAGMHISTNAILPERALKAAKTALENGVPVGVGVSIDGIGEEHDRLRGVPGNFKKVDELLKEFIALRSTYNGALHIGAGFVVSDATLHSLEAVRKYAREMKIDLLEQWYNESVFYGNIGRHTFSADLARAVRSQTPSPMRDLWLKYLNGKSIKFPCFAMNTFCVLKCNGDIVPCLTHFDVPGGNVREKMPTEIWHSEEMKKARKIVKNCAGCLNSWGVDWSYMSSGYHFLFYYLRHPGLLIERLKSADIHQQ